MSKGDTPGERQWWRVYIQNGAAAYSQSDVSCTFQCGFPLPSLWFWSSWVSFSYGRSSLTAEAFLWPHCHYYTTITTTTVLQPFFRAYPGELMPEENFWTLWCNGRLTEADTPTIQLSATPSGLTSAHLHHPPFFYRPDALPATEPSVSKHWRQLAHCH